MVTVQLVVVLLLFKVGWGQGANPQGLYFKLGNTTLLPGSSVLFSDIGHHPHDRADPGFTLVCVTTNVNRYCCRGADGGNAGEWYYPDGSLVPRPFNTENPTLFRVGYTHQLRLGTQGDPVGPFGMYTCEVPNSSGIKVNATIFIIDGSLSANVAYLHDTIYPNNSVIDLEDIGEGGAGLHCYTEVATCCRSTDNPNGHSSGQWLFPNGEVVGSRTSSRPDVFSRTRDRRSVILHRGPEATGPTGIFTCEVPDRSGATQKLYFGIYNKLEGSPTVTSITYDNPSREVSCASTGGPTTSVIWNRSGPTYKNSKRIVNTIQAQYINTLTVPSSEELTDATESFTCLVSNSRGNSSRTLSLYQGTNPQGLYFRLGNTTLLPESSVLFSDIGHHPHDRADPGSTLVCVTTNVNQHCCRGADGGNVGEWYYPDGSQVPRPFSTENPTLFRVGYTHQLRLGTEGDPVGPFGVYTCEVPNSSGIKVNATIFINGLLSVLPPPPPTNVTQQAQSTSVVLAWFQSSQDTVESYIVQYEATGECVDSLVSVATMVHGTRYNITGLEQNIRYKITLFSHNSAGNSSRITFYVSTLPSAPQCCIPEPVEDSANSSSFTVSWGREDCLSRNGDVRYYEVRYRQLGSSEILGSSIVDINHRVFIATSVSYRTSYVFEVALVNEVGVGPFTSKTIITHNIPYVAYLGETLYPNNSVIDIEDIGEGGAGLHCYTEVATCCRSMDNPNGNSGGLWLFPNGEVVGSRSSSRPDVFSRTRDRRNVILHRGPEATGPTGIFTCEVPDRSGATQKLYFGLYSRFGGSPTVTSITYDNSSREVTCASTGGPATSVIWNRSGPTYKNSKRIVNTIQARYINTLTVPSSEELTDATESFTCLVSNSRGNSSKTLSLYQVSSGTAESDLTTAEQILLAGGSFPVLLALYVAVAVVAVVFTIMFIIILVLCIRQRKPRRPRGPPTLNDLVQEKDEGIYQEIANTYVIPDRRSKDCDYEVMSSRIKGLDFSKDLSSQGFTNNIFLAESTFQEDKDGLDSESVIYASLQ